MFTLTNRELAALILLVLFVLLATSSRSVREVLPSLRKSLLNIKIIVPLLTYVAYLIACIWLASRVKLWEKSILKETIVGVVGSGFALFLKFDEASRDPSFFRRKIRFAIALSVFYGFFINLKSFSLPLELIGRCVIAMLAITSVFAGSQKQYASTKKISDRLLAIIGIGVSFAVVHYLYHHWRDLNYGQLWRSLVLPIWLPIVALPFIFLLALFADYENAFTSMLFANDLQPLRLRAKMALLLGLHLRLSDVHAFFGSWAAQIASASSFRMAYASVRDFRDHRSQQQADEAAARTRLERFAGVDGVDSNGMRLDRREFESTQEALQWLATCQMGWYRSHGNRYQKDLLEKLTELLALWTSKRSWH